MMTLENFSDRAYEKAEKLTRRTPLTPLGWFIFILLIAVPFLIGCAFAIGYQFNSELIQLQSRTNGMEHTTNYEQVHGRDFYGKRN